jgi:hypothetical protein
MAFTSLERTQLLAHLRALRVLRADAWKDERTSEQALDEATADQETAARNDLPTLERLRTGLATVDSRFSVKELVGEVVFRENEHDLRVQQYAFQLEQLGLIFDMIDPIGGGYAVSSEPQRSVL